MLRGLTAWICALALAACSGSEFTSSSTGGAGGTTPSGGSGGSGGVAGGGAGGVTSGGAAGVGAAGAAGSGGAGAGGAGGMGAAGGKGGTGGLGGTGACSADLTSDPEHCGACFHSCLGAACNAGYCARTKVYSPNQPVGLALNGTDLYWGSDGANDVKRAPKDGSGVPLKLVTESSAVYYLGILGSELFWTNAAKDCKKQALSAGTPSVVEPGLGKPLGVALAGGKAYVSEYDDSKIAVLDAVSGGEKASYPLPTASGPEGIATDGTTLYVALLDAGQIVSMPVAGGTPKYFVSGQEKPAGVAVDNEAVYWTTQGSPGRLRKKSKSGGTVVELATSLVLPTGVAVDATHVYFADRGANAIYRVAK